MSPVSRRQIILTLRIPEAPTSPRQSYTPNPRPQTLNPKPQNPKPQTLKPLNASCQGCSQADTFRTRCRCHFCHSAWLKALGSRVSGLGKLRTQTLYNFYKAQTPQALRPLDPLGGLRLLVATILLQQSYFRSSAGFRVQGLGFGV